MESKIEQNDSDVQSISDDGSSVAYEEFYRANTSLDDLFSGNDSDTDEEQRKF